MALSSDQQRRVATRLREQLATQADRTGAAAGRLWDQAMADIRTGLSGDLGEALYRTAYNDLPGFVEFRTQSAALWDRSRAQSIRTTAAAHSLQADMPVVAVHPATVPGVPPSTSIVMNVTRRALQSGLTWAEATAIGRSRIEELHRTKLYESSRRSGDVWANQAGYRGRWVRVLTGMSCDWCALVSTQTYHTAASASFGHDNCDCEVAPLGDGETDRGLYDRLRDDGVADRIEVNRIRSRALEQADAAEQRSIAAMVEARNESDPVRRERLIARARDWDDRAHTYRVRAAETVARPRPESHTGYVNPDGSPAPRPETGHQP